jgi:ubiquinone biosynthesis protein
MSVLGAIGHSFRILHAGWVMAREGVFNSVDASLVPPNLKPMLVLARLVARPSGADDKGMPRIAQAIARLGPSYVKLGQFLATRPDIVGAKIARDLEALQDRMAPFARTQAVGAIETAFGAKLADIFSDFGEPIAAASIAQVHKARVNDALGSRTVAVKVLRPDVERRFRRDIRDMHFAAALGERLSPEARRLRVKDVVTTLERSVRMEMDLRLEAAAASEFAENNANEPDFIIPDVDWDRTAQNILTTRWIDGISLSNLDALRAAGHDLPRLARIVIQSFLRHAMRDGLFHADMHQGNLFVDPEGRVVAVDFGIMGRLGAKEQRFLAEILYGFITRDYRRVAAVHFEAGYVPSSHSVEDFAQAIRAIGEPIHSRTADQISMAKLLTLLFEITSLFDMRTRTELVMLQKTMVVVEGVARSLDPKLDMWATAEPVVADWIRSRLGPAGLIEDAGKGLAAIGRVARQLPDLVDRAEQLARSMDAESRKSVSIQDDVVSASRWRDGQLVFWVIAALLAILILKS